MGRFIKGYRAHLRVIDDASAHPRSYLDELCYRLNRRDQRLDLFHRVLNRCVLYTPPTTYAQLIARAA